MPGTAQRTLLLTLLLGLAGCAGYMPLQRTQTALLSQGSSEAQVQAIIGKATLLAGHEFSVDGQRYLARHYDLQTGTRQQMSMRCNRRRGCVPMYYDLPITDAYVVVYRQPAQQLYAWGTLEELSRSPDDAVSRIMPALKAAYTEQQKRQ